MDNATTFFTCCIHHQIIRLNLNTSATLLVHDFRNKRAISQLNLNLLVNKQTIVQFRLFIAGDSILVTLTTD